MKRGALLFPILLVACGGGIATEPTDPQKTSTDASAPPPTSHDPAPPSSTDPPPSDPTVTTACTPPPPPSSIAPLPGGSTTSSAWGDSKGTTPPLTIDLAACVPGRYFASLPLGSAWVVVAPAADASAGCNVWLGGETENPRYDGSASQYCAFPTSCSPATLTVSAGGGGPAHVDLASYCTP